MRVLVTGAGGFLGRQLSIHLAAQGFSVLATWRRTEPRFAVPAPTLLRVDLAEATELPKGIDAVVHAAATSAWAGISADAMARDNVEATRRLVGLAANSGARLFVFCSSVSVYGDVTVAEVDEATSAADPDVYGMSKRIGEALLADAAPRLCGLALRLPAVIGPGADRNFLAMSVRRLRKGQEAPIFNPEAPFNNAVHCADLGVLIGGVLRRGWQGFDTLVLGAAGRTTIRAAVERLRARLHSTAPIVVRPAHKGAFLLRCDRAIQRYGYAPQEISAMLDRYAGEAGDCE